MKEVYMSQPHLSILDVFDRDPARTACFGTDSLGPDSAMSDV
jgi:hypothetical protein